MLFKTRFNGTEAYLSIHPGSSREAAQVSASRLLSNAKSVGILQELSAEAARRNELDQDYIIGCWVAISQADVMDYFETDDKGTLTLRNLANVEPRLRRSIASIKVRTQKINEMVTEQHIELKLCDKVGVLRDMGNAAGLLKDLGDKSTDNVAASIEAGFDRVRKKLGARTFDASGVQVQEGELLG